MATEVKCSTCQVCGLGGRSDNVRRHTKTHHTDVARINLDASGGVGRTWMAAGPDHTHILVSLPLIPRIASDPNRGGAVGLCTLCGDQWHPAPGQHIPDRLAFFRRHTCHTVKPRVRKAPVPTEGMSKARVGAVVGTVITGAHLSALAKRYPGFDLTHTDDCDVDVMATLTVAAAACDRLAAQDKAALKGTVGATGDVWSAVLTEMTSGDDKIAEHVRSTWATAKEQYTRDVKDWEDEHEDDEAPPVPPAEDTVKRLALRSAKLEAAQADTKAAVGRARAALEEEIRDLTIANTGLRARNVALETSNVSLINETSRLQAEINALRAALLAAKTKSEELSDE